MRGSGHTVTNRDSRGLVRRIRLRKSLIPSWYRSEPTPTRVERTGIGSSDGEAVCTTPDRYRTTKLKRFGQKKGSLTATAADERWRGVSIPARRDSYRDECGMSIQVTVRSMSVVLCLAGVATAQEPPPLEPPDLEPPKASAPQPQQGTTPKPANPQPASPKPASAVRQGAAQPAPARPEAGPMLAIPGVTAPSSRPQPAGPPQSGISPYQSVASLGFSSKVLISTRSTISPVIVGGTPERYSSANPGRRSRWKRPRHLHTVCGDVPTSRATAWLVLPSAQASTIRVRMARDCVVQGRRAHEFQRLPTPHRWLLHRCGRSAWSRFLATIIIGYHRLLNQSLGQEAVDRGVNP